MEQKQQNFDEGFEEIPSNWMQWGKIGNVIKGTLIDTFTNRDNYTGKEKINYVIKAQAGEFNEVKDKLPTENIITMNKNEVWNIGGRHSIDRVLQNVKLGTKVLIRYIGDFKTPKGVAKTFEVKAGGIDLEWEAERIAQGTGGEVVDKELDFN